MQPMAPSRFRLPALMPDELSEKQRSVYEAVKNGPRGDIPLPFRIMLHQPDILADFQSLGISLIHNGALSKKTTELIVLVTAKHFASEYVLDVHVAAATKAGLTQSAINAIMEGSRPSFESYGDDVIYRFCIGLLSGVGIDENDFIQIKNEHGANGIINIIGLIGYYTTLSALMKVALRDRNSIAARDR